MIESLERGGFRVEDEPISFTTEQSAERAVSSLSAEIDKQLLELDRVTEEERVKPPPEKAPESRSLPGLADVVDMGLEDLLKPANLWAVVENMLIKMW